ncbi:MAG TPA: hypothetical protein GX706_00350, partial [Candidatus Moranbacteria bacterium]|nr:hypothetical protein [Candidatus Moranbacteria bacterium]
MENKLSPNLNFQKGTGVLDGSKGKAEQEDKKESVFLYDDSELGTKDIFFKDSEGNFHKNIDWKKLDFNHKFSWLKGEVLAQLKEKGIKEESKIYQKLDRDLSNLANKTKPSEIKQIIEKEASAVRPWLDSNQTLSDQEKNTKAYVDSQESLFCLMEAYSRVYRRQLEKLKNLDTKQVKNNLETEVGELFSDEKVFEPHMKDAFPGKIPTQDDSLVTQVAFAIENGRKQELPGAAGVKGGAVAEATEKLPEKKSDKLPETVQIDGNEVTETGDEELPVLATDKEDLVNKQDDGFYPPVLVGAAGLPILANDKAKELDRERHKVNLVAMDQVLKSMAWRIAEEKVREFLHKPEEEMSSSSRLKSIWNNIYGNLRNPKDFLKKSWVRMAEEGYREKFYQEALEEITQNQDLLRDLITDYRFRKESRGVGGDKEKHYQILDKEIERFQNHVEELEERGNNLTNPEVNIKFQELVSRFCVEGWDRERFEAEQRDLVNELKEQGLVTDADFLGSSGRDEDEVAQGRMFASNLYHIAEAKRSEIAQTITELSAEQNLSPEQQEKIREFINLTMELDIHLGAALTDLQNRRPEGQLGMFTRGMAWLQGRTVFGYPVLGKMIGNPGSAAVLGAVAGSFGSRWLVGGATTAGLATAGVVTGAWIPILSAATAAGVVGGLRRNLEVKRDLAMHKRQRALGSQAEGFRRENLDRFAYETRSTDEMMEVLIGLKEEQADGTFRNKEFGELTVEQRESLADMLARFDIERDRAREFRQTGVNRTVDLITVSEEEGKEYKTNILSKSDLEIGLKLFLRNNGLIDENNDLVVNDSNQDFIQLFEKNKGLLNAIIDRADLKADQYKRRSVASIVGLSAAFGAVGSAAGQHLIDYFRGGSAYTTIDNMKDILKGRSSSDQILGQLSGSVDSGGASIGRLIPGQLNTINVGNDKVDIFFKPDGSGIDFRKSNLPAGWSVKGDNLVRTIGEDMDVLKLNGEEASIIAGGSTNFNINDNNINLYFNDQGAIDIGKTNAALASLKGPGAWKLSDDGKELLHVKFSEIVKSPDFSQPVSVTNFGNNVPDFKLYFNDNGSLNIDEINKNLSGGWSLSEDGSRLIQEVAGVPKPVNTVDDFKDFAQSLGVNYDENQRISYGGFFDQKTAPDKGVRSLPETTRNILNNLKLNADSTELGMRYLQDQEGNVIVDISKMIDIAKLRGTGVSDEDISSLLAEGKVKLGLSLDNSTGGTQHHPIILEMDATGKIKVPENIAKIFFAFDQDGKLIQGSGSHPGLHSLFYDTGEEVDAKGGLSSKVIGIAHTYGERPELFIPTTSTQEVPFDPNNFRPEEIIERRTDTSRYPLERLTSSARDEVYQIIPGGDLNNPDTVPIIVPASRWQLEGERREEESKERALEELRSQNKEAIFSGDLEKVAPKSESEPGDKNDKIALDRTREV